MRIALISNDEQLQRELKATTLFESVTTYNSIDLVNVEEVVIASDKEVDYNKISMIGQEMTNKKIFFMVSNHKNTKLINNIITLCESKNIYVIPPKLTCNQIIERIIATLFPDINFNKKVFAFMGADHKVGVTQTGLSTAEMIIRNSNASVCYLNLNGYPGLDFLNIQSNENTAGIDTIKSKLRNKIIKSNELKDKCIRRGNLFILSGVNLYWESRKYEAEDIEFLIDLASQEFDITIIDAGCELDMSGALVISALNTASTKFFVTTQHPIAKERFSINEQALNALDIDPQEFLMIVNKYIDSRNVATPDRLANSYNMMLTAYLPYIEELGLQAEYDRKSLLSYENQEYNAQVEIIAKLICNKAEIEYTEKEVKKKSLLGKVKVSMF